METVWSALIDFTLKTTCATKSACSVKNIIQALATARIVTLDLSLTKASAQENDLITLNIVEFHQHWLISDLTFIKISDLIAA